MSSNPNKTVTVKTSKTDKPVPVINDVHLHSIYNPDREAESFVTANEVNLAKQKKVLIFGLGFGYHIEKIENRLKALHPKDYQVFVIEPNKELVAQWKEIRPTSFSGAIKVVQYDDVIEFFKDKELVNFLSEKPTVIAHPASFQLNETFFKNFMSFHYPTTVKESERFIESKQFADYLMSNGGDETTDEFFDRVRGKSILQSYDFLTLALNEMVSGK